MNEYKYIRLKRDLLKDLNDLFITSSKKRGNYDKFIKKYDTTYAGVQYIGYLAYDCNNKPVAFYGLIPCIAMYQNERILIAQAVDGLTQPNHQRKGLFTQLIKLTTELAKSEGIHFIYGIPNELSFPVFIKKLKWPQNGNMLIYKFSVLTLPFNYLFMKGKKCEFIFELWTNFVLLFYNKVEDSFINSNINCDTFGIFRDQNYFNYKTYKKKYTISILQKKVWFSVDGALKIGDIEYSDIDTLKIIIRKLKIISFLVGARKIIFQFSPKSKQVDLFSKIKVPLKGLPIIYLNLSEIYSPENFVISLADFDTF